MAKKSTPVAEQTNIYGLRRSDIQSEPEVETRLLNRVFTDLGYAMTSIIPKKSLAPLWIYEGSKRKRITVDFVLNRPDGSAFVAVEAKDPKLPIQNWWGQAASYALSYNRDKPAEQRIKYLLISNGHVTSLYPHDGDRPLVTLELRDFVSGAPPYVQLRSLIKAGTTNVVTSPNALEFGTPSPGELNTLFQQSHQMVWKKEKLAPADAFYEFCKFIFLKIRADKQREVLPPETDTSALPLTLPWLNNQSLTSRHPVRDLLFVQLRDQLEEQVRQGTKRRIFEPTETFKLSAETTRSLIAQYQCINLSSIDEDLNGRMFEVFLNAAVRGKELGQFFTPRPLVDFMTRVALLKWQFLEKPPRIVDASCGTAGFLIEAMAYMVATVRNASSLSETQKRELCTHICNEQLFGVEANERVSRIARINMYLHGDGGSHIFNGDGLDSDPLNTDDMSPERTREIADISATMALGSFDIVLTNPPFSMGYDRGKDDERRILEQLTLANGRDSMQSNVMFLQRYFDLLKGGGELLAVLDDTVLNGSNMKYVRNWILERFIIVGVHSLPFNAFFKAQANIKTSVLHLRKKTDDSDVQGDVFMSISNNIGHNNAGNDTPQRNNLNDILAQYLEWKRTGHSPTICVENHDRDENLECPMQIWVQPAKSITSARFDAFYYCPELVNVRKELAKKERQGEIQIYRGRDLNMLSKISKDKKRALKDDLETAYKYVEISNVTNFGLVKENAEGPYSTLPTRAEYQVKMGDVLMAINNSSRGTVVITPEFLDGGFCTSGFYVIRPKNNTEGLLLWYALRSEHCRKQIYYLAQTASQPELKSESWQNEFLIPIPTGEARNEALTKCREFQRGLSVIQNAESIRFS